jgi:beta-lactamase superfamily II metal-dependent hydrolase
MNIKFLKAGKGDSILINHKSKNILIDGGNDSSFLFKEIDSIKDRNEFIDLLIITHHDDDHIAGIIDILNKIKDGVYSKDFVKKVIFNSPRLIQKKIIPKDERLLSYSQAHIVEDLLIECEIEWMDIVTDTSNDIKFEDMTLTFLSPDKSSLEKYSENKGALLSSDSKCDWDKPMSKLKKWIDDESLDKSIANKSSVVVLAKCKNKRVLLPGDVTPDRFHTIIEELYEKNSKKLVTFDYIKLPHHGSYRNLTREILSKIDCTNYIISTNGQNHCLPDKRALLKIILFMENKDKETINFLFNYESTLKQLNITDKELLRYKISLEPNNEENGYCIR